MGSGVVLGNWNLEAEFSQLILGFLRLVVCSE